MEQCPIREKFYGERSFGCAGNIVGYVQMPDGERIHACLWHAALVSAVLPPEVIDEQVLGVYGHFHETGDPQRR